MIQRLGGISERDMFNTFNMGTGMSVIVNKNDADKALEILRENGQTANIIGQVQKGDLGVKIC